MAKKVEAPFKPAVKGATDTSASVTKVCGFLLYMTCFCLLS